MRRGWFCGRCQAELGRVSIDRSGRATLDLWFDAVYAVIPQINRTCVVECRCGHRREFSGWRVRFAERAKAA